MSADRVSVPLATSLPIHLPLVSLSCLFLEAEQKREERKKVGEEEIKEKVPEGQMTKSTKTLGKGKLETGIKLFLSTKIFSGLTLNFFYENALN